MYLLPGFGRGEKKDELEVPPARGGEDCGGGECIRLAGKEESLKEQTLKITWWIDLAAFWIYLIVFTSYFLVTIVNGIESQLFVDP